MRSRQPPSLIMVCNKTASLALRTEGAEEGALQRYGCTPAATNHRLNLPPSLGVVQLVLPFSSHLGSLFRSTSVHMVVHCYREIGTFTPGP